MPPPHHYEFAVTVSTADQGEVAFWPDYPGPDRPKWTERFDVAPDSLAELHRLMGEAGICTRQWETDPDPPVGGSLEWLEVVAGGASFSVPADACDAGPAKPVYEFIRELVPQAIWKKLRKKHAKYQKKHRE